MPTVEGLQFSYALHPLPPGGFGFRRWRWELWHGATLLAAGWRVSRSDSERALRAYAARAAHAVFGLRPPERPAADSGEGIPLGATVHVESGAVRCLLVPRHLEAPRARLAGSH